MIVAVLLCLLVQLSIASLPVWKSSSSSSPQSCEVIAVTTPFGYGKPQAPALQEDIHLVIEFGDTFLVFHQNVPALILDNNAESGQILSSVFRVDGKPCYQIVDSLYYRSRVHQSELVQYVNRTVTLWHNYGILLVIKSNPMEEFYGFSALVENFATAERIITLATTSRPGTIHETLKRKASHVAQAVPDDISINGWYDDVSTLASYNRYTRSQGIVNAEYWLLDELAAYGNSITVQQQPWTSGTWSGRNTIATIQGNDPNSFVIVGAHFDSTSQSPTTSAPGAEDDGSGSAALLQFLRVLVESGTTYEKTIILVWFGGEEQGLLGSRAYVTSLINSGRASGVYFALCMDMIAYSTSNNYLSVILETYSRFDSYLNPLRNAAATYAPDLEVVTSHSPFGSDHMSFLNQNIASALTIDTDWDSYPHYHRTTDTVDKLVPDMALQIMRMNIAAIVEMASS